MHRKNIRYLIYLFLVAIATATLMFFYELAITTFSPNIKTWNLHIITIVFSTSIAVIAVWLVIREYEKHNRQLFDDIHEQQQLRKELHSTLDNIESLRNMGELLQSCIRPEEAYDVFKQTASLFMPDDNGALYVFSSSRNILEPVAIWGKRPPDVSIITPHDCWALRRGKNHLFDGENGNVRCSHINMPDDNSIHLCLPMMASGETIGMLYVKTDISRYSEVNNTALKAKQSLITSISEQMALAISNLKLKETLKNLSIRDPLTALFNRRFMEESLEREQIRAERNTQSFGIIMFDIDHFKKFNDTFGHDAGDALLRELGVFLINNIRGSDIACRYGGEEFTIIMPDTDLDTVRKRAELLREKVSRMNVKHEGQSLGLITLSLGVAGFPYHGPKVEAVLKAADTALYRAKAEGRDRVCVSE